MRAWSAALILAVAAPVAAASTGEPGLGIWNPEGPVPFTWYAHLDGLQDFPISPQAPPDDFVASLAYGATTSTATCIDQEVFRMGAFHTWYGYAYASELDYLEGRPRYHPERGIANDLTIEDVTAHWYLETQATPEQSAPVPVPRVVVAATMRAGDDISVDEKAYNEGAVIAQGATAPAELSPALSGHPDVEHISRDGRHVYHFTIPLQIANGFVSRQDSFNLRVDAYVDLPGCDADRAVMPNTVRALTAPELRPRLEGSQGQPIGIRAVGAQVGAIVGIDVETFHAIGPLPEPIVTITGDAGAVEVPRDSWSGDGYSRGMHCHCYGGPTVHHYLFAPPEPGRYIVHVTASEGSVEATASAAFHTDGRVWNVTVGGVEEPAGTTDAPLPLLPLLALGATVAHRRATRTK